VTHIDAKRKRAEYADFALRSAGIGAEMGPKQGVRTIRKLLIRPNFRITLEKLGRQKINSPSRHHKNPSPLRPEFVQELW
jgi:hypothetical protein